MHPEMEPNYSKQRLIFRPKSLLLGWWGGCIPPIPPLNPPLDEEAIQEIDQMGTGFDCTIYHMRCAEHTLQLGIRDVLKKADLISF